MGRGEMEIWEDLLLFRGGGIDGIYCGSSSSSNDRYGCSGC